MVLELQWLFLLMIIPVCLSLVQADYSQCHPWSFYNDTSQVCQCYETQTLPTFRTHHDFIIECSERRVLMNAEYCLTNEVDGTLNFVGKCSTYLINKNVTMVDGIYIQLPDNISQLNDYMCGPMNRKGRICSECIDGFAPSVTSFGYECSNCTGSWYGIPLYLFLEFVPITIFYLAVQFFQISVTSSPMTFCVMYSQAVCYMFTQAPFLMFFNKLCIHSNENFDCASRNMELGLFSLCFATILCFFKFKEYPHPLSGIYFTSIPTLVNCSHLDLDRALFT